MSVLFLGNRDKHFSQSFDILLTNPLTDNDNNCYSHIDVFKTDGFFENDLLINL